MEYKYTAMLNIVFIAFMFGSGIPILFPIALLGIIIEYLVERLCLAYFYKKSEYYHRRVNVFTVGILYYAPFIYCMIGFWMYGNKQLFTNRIGHMDRFNGMPRSHHTIPKAFKRVDQSFPFLVGLVVGIIGYFLPSGWFKNILGSHMIVLERIKNEIKA